MKARIHEELALLQQRYGELEHGPNLDWVQFSSWRLPTSRFNREFTPLCFRLPVGYPQTGPDNFFVDQGLRLANGGMPPAFNANPNSTSGAAPLPGDWGWFSWHPQTWRPAAQVSDGDNLLVFMLGVQMCLRGEEAA